MNAATAPSPSPGMTGAGTGAGAPPDVSAQWLRRANMIVKARQRDIDEKAAGVPIEKRTPYSAEDAHEDFDALFCEIAERSGQREIVSLFNRTVKRF